MRARAFAKVGFLTAAAVLCGTAFVVHLSGAQQTPQTPPTFRSRTDLVPLDISVLDKNRRPVRGLTAADFLVLENGKPQQVAVFEAIDLPDPTPPPAAWMRDVTPDVATNGNKARRLWLILLDDALVRQTPTGLKESKRLVRDVIDRLGPDDLATIVFTADSRGAQDFTADRTKLLATLENYSPGLATGLGSPDSQIDVDPDWQFQLGAMLTLRNIMDTMVAVPHARKALVWISPGMTGDFSFLFKPTEAPRSAAQAQRTMHRQQVQLRLIDLHKEVFEVARRANIPIYPVNPHHMGMPNDYLITVANNTGGHQFLISDWSETPIDSIFAENQSYYLIGYYPTNATTDGSLRTIHVNVNREDVEVRTRNSYFAPKPGSTGPSSMNTTLLRAIADPVDVRELPLRATVAPFAIPGKSRTAAVAIALGVNQPVPEGAAAGRVTVTTELRTNAYTTEGDLKGSQRHTAKVTLRAGAQGDADYEALSRLDLPPGRYRLRLAAHHEAAAKTGTVMVDVVVPDFNREPASMSGVVLTATPGRPSAPRDLLAGVIPVVPTAQREFTSSDRAKAVFYLYQSGLKPIVAAQLAIRVVDGHGATLINESQAVPVARFLTAKAPDAASTATPSGLSGAKKPPQITSPLSAAEVQYALPLDRLPAGPYLVTFEATIGSLTLRRDVQFSRR